MSSGTALALLKTLDFCDPQSPFRRHQSRRDSPRVQRCSRGARYDCRGPPEQLRSYSSNLTDIVEGGNGKFATAKGAGNLTNSDIFVNPPMTPPDPGDRRYHNDRQHFQRTKSEEVGSLRLGVYDPGLELFLFDHPPRQVGLLTRHVVRNVRWRFQSSLQFVISLCHLSNTN